VWIEPDLNDPAVVGDALRSFPVAAYLRVGPNLSGSGKLAPFLDWVGSRWPLLLEGIDFDTYGLLQMAVAHDGIRLADVPERANETSVVDVEHLQRCAQHLVVAGLATIVGEELRAAPEIAAGIPTPLPRFDDWVESILAEDLGRACRLLGLDGGTRKAERVTALRAAFHDPRFLAQQIDQLSEKALRLLDAFVAAEGSISTSKDHPVGAVHYRQVTTDTSLIYGRRTRTYGSRTDDATSNAVDELVDRVLVQEDSYHFVAWTWLEVAIARRGGRYGRLVGPSAPSTAAIDEAPGAPSAAVSAAHQLLDVIAAAPLEGKRTGDQRPPVKAAKSAGSLAGVAGPTAVLLIDLLIEIGVLVARQLPPVGRGRNAVYPVAWEVDRERRAAFGAEPLARQWLRLATAWFFPDAWTPAGSDLALTRLCTVSALARLPAGEGVPASTIQRWLATQALALNAIERVGGALRDMVALGMVSGAGVVGLTAAGRAFASGGSAPKELVAAIGEPARTFTVLPDHTVLAPANLAPDVRSTLALIADVESEGSATMWRLSATRLTEAGAATTADELLSFLATTADNDLPANVERFVRDSVGGASRVDVSPATSVIQCDDPATLADAARHKAAKLTVIAPTVAVSTLPAAKVAEVLRKKGVALAVASAVPAPTSPAHSIVGSPTAKKKAAADVLPAIRSLPALSLAGATEVARNSAGARRRT